MSFVFLLPQQQHWQLHWQRPFELVAACFQMQPACQRQLDWPRFHFHGWGTYRNSKWDVAVVFIGCIIIIINQEREISPSDSSNNKGKEKENSKRREVKRCFLIVPIAFCLLFVVWFGAIADSRSKHVHSKLIVYTLSSAAWLRCHMGSNSSGSSVYYGKILHDKIFF